MHKHAENMKLYAQDAAETDTPWERWEYRDPTCIPTFWKPCERTPFWDNRREYRRKPRTIIIIGSRNVPAPEKNPPSFNSQYYMPSLSSETLSVANFWQDSRQDRARLRHGAIHLNREAAIAHARALIEAVKPSRDIASEALHYMFGRVSNSVWTQMIDEKLMPPRMMEHQEKSMGLALMPSCVTDAQVTRAALEFTCHGGSLDSALRAVLEDYLATITQGN